MTLLVNDNQKIMHIIENVLKATSKENAVSLMEVINTGIRLGLTEPMPRNGHDGHPWFPHVSLMMGIGLEQQVKEKEEIYLHRQKMHNGSRVQFLYWVDRNSRHRKIKNGKTKKQLLEEAKRKEEEANRHYSPAPINLPVDERFKMYQEAKPGEYRLVGGKIIEEDWIQKHPDKAFNLYGIVASASAE